MNKVAEATPNHGVDTVFIPMAGLGSRMWPVTADLIPKYILPGLGTERDANGNVVRVARPNIDFTLVDCLGAGIRNFVFCVSGDGEDFIRRRLGPFDPKFKAASIRHG